MAERKRLSAFSTVSTGRLLCGLCGAILLGACSDRESAKEADRQAIEGVVGSASPNVLLITVDTLRKDNLGCYGHRRNTSPRIDELARNSVIYHRAYSQAPWTTPSLGSLLSSLYPAQLGIVDEESALADEVTLLSEVLQRAGYRTGAVVSHSFCSTQWNFGQGFDVFDESNILGYDEITSEGVSDRALELLDDRQDRPFFLWLHYFDPHGAYCEHEAYSFREPGQPPGRFGRAISLDDLRTISAATAEQDIDQVRRHYDSEIAHTDHHIGRVLDRLRELGVFERTIIVFTADHGEAFGEHGLMGHTTSLFDELVNVPLIVKYPNRQPAAVNDVVALLDVYPTVLESVGLPVPAGLEGRSFGALTAENTWDRGPVFLESRRRCDLRAVIHGDLKVIQDLEKNTLFAFDLAADSRERQLLQASQRPELPALRETLGQWMRTVQTLAPGRKVKIDASEAKRLEALGYLQDRDRAKDSER